MLITPFSLLMFVMAGLLAWVAWQVSKRTSAPGGLPLTLLLVALIEWAIATGFEAAVVGIPAKLTASKFQYPGIASSSVLFLWFGFEFYSQQKLIYRPVHLLLWVIPVITVLMGATNEYHLLMWSSMTPAPAPAVNLIIYGHGTWFWIHVAFYYTIVAAASIMLLQAAIRFRNIYRYQAIALLTGIPLPWVINVIYVFGLGSPGEDLTVLGFGVSGIIFSWALRRFQMLDLVPVARDRVVEWMDNCLIVLDRQLRVVDVNTAVLHMMSRFQPDQKLLSSNSLIGKPVSQAFSVCPHLVDILERKQEGRYELRILAEGRHYEMDLHVSAIHDQVSGQVGWWAMLSDITDLQRAREEALQARDRALQAAAENSVLYEQMRQMALTDPLTGLSTRRHFFNMAAIAFEWAIKNHLLLTAIMLDIDHFKQVNDCYGHAVGDRILELVARACQDALRKSDLIGRYGGEEFAILLPDTPRDRALQIADRLRLKIDQLSYEAPQGKIGVTVSLGVAEYAGSDDCLDALIDRADRGMYAAKQAGRNRVKFSGFSPEPPGSGDSSGAGAAPQAGAG